jgi:uncharacterized membrane protein YdfJ with MMPL/SSD domain
MRVARKFIVIICITLMLVCIGDAAENQQKKRKSKKNKNVQANVAPKQRAQRQQPDYSDIENLDYNDQNFNEGMTHFSFILF